MPEEGQARWLKNVVLRFPDPAAATAPAAEMAAKHPGAPDAPPGRPAERIADPSVIAKVYDLPDGAQQVQSVAAHGPYVLYQQALTAAEMLGIEAELLVKGTLDPQRKRIDQFAPTEVAKLPDLPLDPTGQLMARTLWSPDNDAPFIIGAWKPRAWLHFEVDPVESAALFDAAAVDAVSQRLTTVYEAGNAEGATRIVDKFAAQLSPSATIKSTGGVPGLPTAKCFARVKGGLPATAAASWRRIGWTHKCVARADRYAYTAFSTEEAAVKQQIAAQYRILAGQ